MKVTLQHHTELWVASDAIRTCWQSGDKSDTLHRGTPFTYTGEKDRELIDRIGNKHKHSSTLEHLTYNFHIEGISRAVLQELARHRMASLSVKSTRYTLKELKEEGTFAPKETSNWYWNDVLVEQGIVQRAEKYIVFTGDTYVDHFSIKALENLRSVLASGISNDLAKYCLPEAYKTELTWTINARSLQNFLSLRTDKAALWEIRDLANAVYEALPFDHKYLFAEYIK